jgi:hypothetical protein
MKSLILGIQSVNRQEPACRQAGAKDAKNAKQNRVERDLLH